MTDLKAIITAEWKGKQATTAASRDLDDLAGNAKQSGKSFTEFGIEAGIAAGVLVGVGAAAKAAYDYIGEGSELSAAQGKFSNLSDSIDTTSDALLGNLKTATKGMISDAELVAGATDIISLGLAKTEDGTVRLATAVGALGLDLDVLALTLANDSVARLDSLGLSMENVRRTQKELSDQGFKGDTFDEAVIIELEKKMVLLGDASETTAGKMQIFETNITNTKDGLALMVAESNLVTESVNRLSGVIAGFNAVQAARATAEDDLNSAVAAGIITQEGANVILKQATRGDELYIERLREVRTELRNLTSETDGYNWIVDQYTMSTEGAIIADENATIARVAAMETSANYADALYEDSVAATEMSNALMEASKETTALAEAQLEGMGVYESAISIIDGYNELLGRSAEATQTAAGRQQEYSDTQADFQANVDISAQRVENLGMKLLGLPTSTNTVVNVDTSAAEAAIGSLERKLFGIGGAASAGADQSTSSSPIDPFAANSGGLATGANNIGGGSYLVGEAGAEIVTLPAGSNVTNASDTRNYYTTLNTNNPGAYMAQLEIAGRRAR